MHPCFYATTEFGTELIKLPCNSLPSYDFYPQKSQLVTSKILKFPLIVMISIHLPLEFISRNARADLHEEDDAHEDGEGGRHAVVLLDRAAAAKEGDEEDDAADDDEEDGRVEELVAKEVEILRVRALDHSSSDNQEQSRELKKNMVGKIYYSSFDLLI